MFGWILVTMVTAAVLGSSRAGVNLLKDGDFEAPSSLHSWSCGSCSFSLVSDSHSGRHSVKVQHRQAMWSGPAQTFPVRPGQKFFFRGYIKLLNKSPDKLYHNVKVKLDYIDPTGKHHFEGFGESPHVQPGIWSEIGGDYVVPSLVKDHLRVYIQIEDKDVNYLLDDARVEEVPHLTNFKAEANSRIDKYRKQDIFVQVDGHGHQPGLTVEAMELVNRPEHGIKKMEKQRLTTFHVKMRQDDTLSQTSSSFPIGSAVKAREIVDPSKKAYQDFFYNNFNWAVVENALKWRTMESTQGHINYKTPEKAVDSLRAHGIKVRGHNIFWGTVTFMPKWVPNLTTSDLKKAMEARVHGVVGHFKGRLEHWDVNNENLHMDWYERRLRDPNITQWMFREAHKADPHAKLFLNDNSAVRGPERTAALVNQAVMFKAAGVPLYGIGIECHFREIDLDLIKHRLDEVARAGLPIWVTEMDIAEQDENKKAQYYEDVLRMLFSHPKVEGIMLWGFWDQAHWRRHAAIATGDDVHPNAAGKRFQHLFQQEWRTHVTQPLHQGQLHVRGFKGDYSVKVLHNGHVISQEKFTLGDSDVHLRIPLTGSGSNPHVSHIIVG